MFCLEERLASAAQSICVIRNRFVGEIVIWLIQTYSTEDEKKEQSNLQLFKIERRLMFPKLNYTCGRSAERVFLQVSLQLLFHISHLIKVLSLSLSKSLSTSATENVYSWQSDGSFSNRNHAKEIPEIDLNF